MGLYYEGYGEAVKKVMEMDETDLYAQLDALYGRDNLPCNPSIEQLRAEALRQLKEDFTDTSSPVYEQVQFWTKVVKATNGRGF